MSSFDRWLDDITDCVRKKNSTSTSSHNSNCKICNDTKIVKISGERSYKIYGCPRCGGDKACEYFGIEEFDVPKDWSYHFLNNP